MVIMGKWKRVCGSFLVFTMVLFWPLYVSADVTEDIRVEQILTDVPEIKVYITGTDASKVAAEDLEMRVGTEQLKTDRIELFSDSGEGICYLFLLDISSSMRKSDFQAAKESILKIAGQIDNPDSCMLLTFGDEVQCIWDGKESNVERAALLADLENNDNNTQMFGALEQAANFKNRKDRQKRSVAIVFTDGKDDILGKASKDEALEELQAQGLPVYGVIVGDADQDTTTRFGEFVRSSGGKLILSEAETLEGKMAALQEELKQSQIAYLHRKTNVIQKSMEEATISFAKQNKNIIRNIGFYDWQEDTVSPEIETLEQIGENQIEIIFTEPMSGIDKAENFEFKDESGKIWTPQSSVRKDDETVVLTFEDEFYEGTYKLSCRNITDDSMEKNPMEEEAEIKLQGKRVSPAVEFLKNWGWLVAIILIILTGILVWLIYRKIKKNKGLLLIDDKLTLLSKTDADVKQRVAVRQVKNKGVILTLKIKTDGTDEAILERNFTNSVIVGRSDMCDLCIEDSKMSRQHFALEYEEGKIIIMDLDSRNGVSVNGVRMQGRKKLAQKDIITAGSSRIRISWR